MRNRHINRFDLDKDFEKSWEREYAGSHLFSQNHTALQRAPRVSEFLVSIQPTPKADLVMSRVEVFVAHKGTTPANVHSLTIGAEVEDVPVSLDSISFPGTFHGKAPLSPPIYVQSVNPAKLSIVMAADDYTAVIT